VLGLINELVAAEQAAMDAQVAEVQQQRLIGLLLAGLLLAVVSVTSARRLRRGQNELVEAQRQLDGARATAEAAAARAEHLLTDMQAAEASYRTVFEGIDDAIVLADATRLPFRDGLFGIVTSVYLFHELPRPARKMLRSTASNFSLIQ
jgi:hypothetical protein